jgi:anti-sigma-K factor RskA
MTEFPVRKERAAGFGWLGWVAAAATLAIAAYLGYGNFKLKEQLSENRSQIALLAAQADRAQELTDALTSPAAKQVTLTESKQPALPVGHATYLPKRGALIFVASNLHPVAADKTYELWLIPANGKAPIPAGLFRPDANGSASVILPPLPEGVEAKMFGVTIEDAQGSATPTLPIVMAGQ